MQDGLQAAHISALQLLQVSPVQGPCLTTVEEAGENDRPVHLQLRELLDVLVQDAIPQAAKSLAGLADPSADLVETPVTAITLPRYLKSSTVFSWVPSIETVGRWATAAETGPLSC